MAGVQVIRDPGARIVREEAPHPPHRIGKGKSKGTQGRS